MEVTEGKKQKHPPKRFAVPADIAALGRYGQTIIQAMRREYQSRMSGSRRL